MSLFDNMYRDDQQARRLRIKPPPVIPELSPNRDICPHDIYIYSRIPCSQCQEITKLDNQKGE